MLLKTDAWIAFKFSERVCKCVTNILLYLRGGTTNDANFKATFMSKMAFFVVTKNKAFILCKFTDNICICVNNITD